MHSQEIASYLAMTLGEKREAKAKKSPYANANGL
jgi:hypothetical protein